MLLAVGIVVAVFAFRKPDETVKHYGEPPPASAPVVASQPVAPTPPKPVPPKPELVEVALPQSKPRALRLGVNEKGYDDVGVILTSLGKGYAFTSLTAADLENENRLGEFDVVFLNCGGLVGDAKRTSPVLRQFVASGKTLYASDLQYALVSGAFSDAADPKSASAGNPGVYKSEVLDEGLQKQLGSSVDLNFDSDGWQAAAFAGPKVVTVLRSADNGDALKAGTPLLVKFAHGNGRIIFTSFHNSAIAGDTARKLLRYLVFSAVLADAEARVQRVLNRDDFTVKTSDVLNATEDGWTTIKTYSLKSNGTFRVAAGFNSEGAEVRLLVEGPGGLSFACEGQDAFIAEVRHVPAGEWKLTLIAKSIPYPNFPLTLITTEPKSP